MNPPSLAIHSTDLNLWLTVTWEGASLYVIYKEVDDDFAVVGGLPYVSLNVHMGYYNKQNECVNG